MPTVSVFDMTGKKVSDIDLKEDIFGITPSIPAMHLCVVAYLANQRQAHSLPLPDRKSAAAARSPGSRRAQAAQDRVRPELRSGITAASPTVPSPALIIRTSTRRSADSL